MHIGNSTWIYKSKFTYLIKSVQYHTDTLENPYNSN